MICELEEGRAISVDIQRLVAYLTDFMSNVESYADMARICQMDRDSVYELIRDDVDVEIETSMSDFFIEVDPDSGYDTYLFLDDDDRTLVTEIIYEMGGDYNAIIEAATEKVMRSVDKCSNSTGNKYQSI